MFNQLKSGQAGASAQLKAQDSSSSINAVQVSLVQEPAKRRIMFKNLGLLAMPSNGDPSDPHRANRANSIYSVTSGGLEVVTEGRNNGWRKVQAKLPAIIDYGVEQGILQPRAPKKPKEDDKPLEERLEDEEAARKKADVVQIEINDVDTIHEAIPFLPVPVAAICLLLNLVIPGTGTMLSGVAALCMGQPRIQLKDGRRITTLLVNGMVGISQLMTTTFFFVGWCWSVAWGGLLITHSLQYREALMQRRQEAVATAAIEALTKDSVLHRRDVQNLVKGKERPRRGPDGGGGGGAEMAGVSVQK